MHSNLPLPKLLEIISRIVNDSGCTVRIVDEIPVQDREIRELCLQIYELRRIKEIKEGRVSIHRARGTGSPFRKLRLYGYVFEGHHG